MKYVIDLTEAQIEKIENLTNLEIDKEEDDGSVDYAIRIIIENV